MDKTKTFSGFISFSTICMNVIKGQEISEGRFFHITDILFFLISALGVKNGQIKQ
jgi:hypothetical protein